MSLTGWKPGVSQSPKLPPVRRRSQAMSLCAGAILRDSGFAGLGNELERDAVVAITLAGGSRPIVEHVTVMAAAADAVVLDARREQSKVLLRPENARDRGEETGPARAAVVFHV